METSTETVSARGLNGSVTFDGKVVTITRGRMSNHQTGERVIPLSRVQGIEVTKPSTFKGAGALTIHVAGASEARTWFGNGRRNNRRNENTVEFNSQKRYREFLAVRDAVLAAL